MMSEFQQIPGHLSILPRHCESYVMTLFEPSSVLAGFL